MSFADFPHREIPLKAVISIKILFPLVIILVVAISSLALAQAPGVVQITDELDANGKCTNWVEIAVTWDAADYTEADVPAPSATDDDGTQDFFVPYSNTVWKHFSFERTKRGNYWVRWRRSDGQIFSDETAVRIVPPGQSRHSDD